MRLFILFFLLFIFTDYLISAAAIGNSGSSAAASSHRFDRLIHSVVRKGGRPDVIHPTVCPPSCEHLHQAINHMPNDTLPTRPLSDQCECTCPPNRPVYLSSAGLCVEKLQECQETIRWKTLDRFESNVPVVHLFPHSVVLPNTPLDFEGSNIVVSPKGQANCTITRLFYENIHHRWKTPPGKTILFELTDFDERPIIYFRGTEFDASFLSGAVVQIKLKCDTRTKSDEQFCVSLRIAGISGAHSPLDRGSSQFEEPGWRIEMILLLAFVSFVVITLLATLIIWNICWKIKKRKLISDFQLQFIQQYRHQHGKIGNQMSVEDIEVDEDSVAPHSLVSNRRRLYFSAEYFDRELLENPPPMAEQFLYDLRRMVDVAKDRIRQRRFNPSLFTIPESKDEDAAANLRILNSNVENEMTSSQESSPRSEPKSIDSGRESKEDSEEDGHEEDEDEPRTNLQNLKSLENLAEQRGVSEIVKNFEKSISRPSQLPVLLTSSIRRKSSGDKPTTPKVITPPSRLPLPSPATSSPRPNSMITERKNEIESRIKPPSAGFGGRSLKEKKGYAVFPSDGTFNKSLPRRPKRVSSTD